MAETGTKLVDQRGRYWLARGLLLACLTLALTSRSVWWDDPWIYLTLESLGILCIAAAMLGRLWATLYIGGRKSQAVVSSGPYAMCRHPLYACSTLAAAGLGLVFGSVLMAVTLGALAFALLSATAAREERALRAAFGAEYQAYARAVPRLIPDPRRFSTPAEVTFSAAALHTNLRDAMGFAALIPLVQAIKMARDTLLDPVLHLP